MSRKHTVRRRIVLAAAAVAALASVAGTVAAQTVIGHRPSAPTRRTDKTLPIGLAGP